MVDRARLLVAAAVLAAGAALFLLGSGPASPGGTVLPTVGPQVAVNATPGSTTPGAVTVRFADAGDWDGATLTVAWTGAVTVVDGEPRLGRVGDAVTLAEREAARETSVRLTVTAARADATTATGEAAGVVVYEDTVVL